MARSKKRTTAWLKAEFERAADRTRLAATLVSALILQAGFLATSGVAAAETPTKVLVFPVELIQPRDFGMDVPITEPEQKRLDEMTSNLRAAVANHNGLALADANLIAADIEKESPIHRCNKCEDDLAKKADAAIAYVANVEKMSAHLLKMTVYVRDVPGSKVTQVASTVIHGNSDRSWQKGLESILKNQLFPEGAGQ